jgi:hypothetical protein
VRNPRAFLARLERILVRYRAEVAPSEPLALLRWQIALDDRAPSSSRPTIAMSS